MTFRIHSIDNHPARVLEHVRDAGCVCRTEQTLYRGPIAFIGNGRVWGVATLHDVKPIVTKLPKAGEEADEPSGFLWCFSDLQTVDGVTCAVIASPAMFQNGSEWEPMFLQASAQVELNRVLSLNTAQEQALMPEMAQLPAEPISAPELAHACDSRGQLEMF